MSTPPISKELLDYLQAIFPNTLPTAIPSLELMGSLIGRQQVIAHLRMRYDEQNKTVLAPT